MAVSVHLLTSKRALYRPRGVGFDVGPTLYKCYINVLCLLGILAHSYRLGLVTWRYQVRFLFGPDICHRGCAYTVLQTVQKNEVYSAVYGTLHYQETLKSFEIRVGQSPGSGLPCGDIASVCCCRKRRKAITYTYSVGYTTQFVSK